MTAVADKALVPDFHRWLTYNPSKRRLRLFCIAAARHTPGLVLPVASVAAVERAESYADNPVGAPWLELNPPIEDHGNWRGIDIVAICLNKDPEELPEWLAKTPACPTAAILSCLAGPCERVCPACDGLGECSVEDFDGRTYHRGECNRCQGSGFIAASLPTLCGVPNHGYHGETVKPWCDACQRILTHNDGTVRKLAQYIYDSRDFDLMGQLVDALEEAGCGVATILEHCRADGGECLICGGEGYINSSVMRDAECIHCRGRKRLPAIHGRGCFVLDCILGRS